MGKIERMLTTMMLGAAITATAFAAPAFAAPDRASAQSDDAQAGDAQAGDAQTGDARPAIALSQGWRFHFGDAPGSVTDARFDDRGWEQVSVPHSWNHIGAYALTRGTETDNRQGVGWYRLWVDAPPAKSGERQYLDFAAVGKLAEVWVNGRHVGTHKGAFARFRLDVTEAWKPGQRNLVVVSADNSKVEPGSSTSEVIPLSGDFFVHGGIYREVSLLQLPAASIDPLDFGGPGVYAYAAKITPESATVEIRTKLRNAGAAPRNLTLATEIRDARGKIVARSVQPVTLAPGASEQRANVNIARPHRWNGRADPYLYSVTSTLSDGKARLDRVSQPLGLRTFRFDADAGFFLNERHVKLHGVSRHQDALGSGWALTPEQHAEDMALIEELGANTIRQAHYQHADAWSDLADKAGMVVWAELPYVTTPSVSGGQGSEALWTNAEQQLREQIRQNYNHPSILMWSVGNEVDSAKGFGVKGSPPKPLALLQHLNAIAKEEDPHRPTTFADCCEGLTLVQTAGEKLAGTADLIGYNRYYGWYYPNPLQARTDLGDTLDKFHRDHPALPLSLSEYGAGGAISQHSDNVRNGFVNFVGRPHPEEYQAWVHEQTWPSIARRDFVFASWVWAMFDFSSDLRDEGDAVDLNDKGLVTADRKERKDAFWFYKVAWSDTPALHLAGKRYVDRAYPVMDVKAYSTASSATLAIDGKPIGTAPCAEFVCEWKNVSLRPGANTAVVTATEGGKTLRDTARWNGPDVERNGLRINSGSLAGLDLGTRQFGSDTFVTGGKPVVLNLVGFGGRSMAPIRQVDAADPALFDYWRDGAAFSYDIPLPNGQWTVTLHLFEPRKTSSPDQSLAVKANGQPVIEGLNLLKEAGAPLKELVRTFPVTVLHGRLILDFSSVSGNAALAGIEITR
ncbi:beta-galactosidase [Novosphingobium sp. PhB57]|uniref:glycoside hydrolase family 2 TIM barrel-domain containing protein n=1 Tax=Novosphingobium sp. PhB57 TaxID=2485107 RepID=UPI0010E40C76|nr:glycoside hydrolase family 2 TIM barrel-domain containing protein [Novosphingobium sp. PhB57]TCU61171.1 beta-galactosidase [Novosphingobium sp. PhB57]